jgi:chemotaxis protein CheX
MSKSLSLALGDQLANDIALAVTDSFGMTFGVKVTPGRYSIGEGAAPLTGDVSGIIGITQEKLEGTFTICFSIDSMKKILPLLLGDGVDVTQDVAADAVGEISNMILGRIKTSLNQRGYEVRLSLPNVVRGPSNFVNSLHEGRHLLMPFDVEGQPFQVHIAVHRDV